VEAAPRLDRCSHDNELGAALGRDARHLLAEGFGPCADDLPPHRHAVRARDRRRRFEPILQALELSVEVRVDRQLELENGRRHEDDAGAAIGREPAREIERMLSLLSVE
jgi:hypothetical protein